MELTAQLSIANHRSRLLHAYETDSQNGPQALAAFLPVRSDPDYVWVLTELIRMDLEQQWSVGNRVRLDDYRKNYPELFEDSTVTRALVVEEYQLRQRFGDEPDAVEYSENYGVGSFAFRVSNLSQTPQPLKTLDQTRVQNAGSESTFAPATMHVSSIRDESAHNLAASADVRYTRYPRVGETFLGFRLHSELGAGAFGKVFLAEQLNLGGRKVALKITTRATHEPEQLAKLRHTNIMPIYSVHDAAPLQAVCMPFLGRSTLADLIREFQTTGIFPKSSQSMASTQRANLATALDNPTVDSSVIPPASRLTEYPEESAVPVPRSTNTEHVDHALWIMARLADGLAHAHDKNLLHLDIKPANVLFADDGQPLLLDFNLAYDLTGAKRERAGGTLPYMAPEQLEDFRDGGSDTRLDQRTDLFAMGVIFFEILTGTNPFPLRTGRPDLTLLAHDRRRIVPQVRALNASVTPAVEAIVQKLLHSDPARRYQSAQEFGTDLECHRLNMPLKFASNPSVRERVTKWRRRNPHSWIPVLVIGLILVSSGFGYTAMQHGQARVQAESANQFHTITNSMQKLRVDLVTRDDAVTRQAGRAKAEEMLAAYGLPQDDQWQSGPMVQALREAERTSLRVHFGELGLLLAHAEWLERHGKSQDECVAVAERGLQWNRMAEHCLTTEGSPAVLYEQRQTLLKLGGQEVSYSQEGSPGVHNSPFDHYFHAIYLMSSNRYREAIPQLEQLLQIEPSHYAGQFALAICWMELADYARASERFQIAKALGGNDPRPSHNRGMIALLRHDLRQANDEFASALQRDPNHAETYKNRALVRAMQKDPRGAIDDLTKALACGASPVQVYHIRAEMYDAIADPVAAEKDLIAAKNSDLKTAQDYVVRGNSRVKHDVKGALADFITASELNPNYLSAWQNQAHIYGDQLEQPAKALESQNKAVDCSPDFALARSGRAVLLARLDRRDEAHHDAQKATLLSNDPMVTYQAACTYALTSEKTPADRPVAIEFLRKSLRDGFDDFEGMKIDPDIDPIRKLAECKTMIEAAKKLHE